MGKEQDEKKDSNESEKLDDISSQRAEQVARVIEAAAGAGVVIGDFLSPQEAEKVEGGIEEYKKQIVDILKSKEKVDPELVRRVLRDLATSQDLQDFIEGKLVMVEGVDEVARKKIEDLAGMLERRSWGKIFTRLQEGDTVVSFSVPGAEFLSLKNLNDTIFDPSVTDSIIAKKRIKIREKITALFPGSELLREDYKIEVARVPNGVQFDEGQLEGMMAEVNIEMVGEIKILAAEFLKRKDLTEAKKTGVVTFLQQLEGVGSSKAGFRMNYGITYVSGDSNQDKILAVNNSVGAARMFRPDSVNYGGEYSEANTLEELNSIKKLRDVIIATGNSITDKDGNEFIVFLPLPVEGTETVYTFNRDLLRDVRKGKFKPKSGQEDLLKQISVYTKKLNILDFVKPFIYEEGLVKVQADTVEAQGLAKDLKTGKQLDKEKLKKMLDSDERAPAFTSRMEFDRRAISMAKAAYISMDVLDLGVDLLSEYQQEIEMINNDPSLSDTERMDRFKLASLRAGDKTTQRLRDFWEGVEKVCVDKKLGEGLITGLVGGDELTLAVEIGNGPGQMTEAQVRDLIFALKNKTNSRVIQTVVAHSQRDNSGETDKTVLAEAHVEAMNRSAEGAAILKNMEEIARKLSRLLAKGKKEGVGIDLKGLEKLFSIEGITVRTDAVVLEKKGKLVVANSNDHEYEVDYNQIKAQLESILDGKNKNSVYLEKIDQDVLRENLGGDLEDKMSSQDTISPQEIKNYAKTILDVLDSRKDDSLGVRQSFIVDALSYKRIWSEFSKKFKDSDSGDAADFDQNKNDPEVVAAVERIRGLIIDQIKDKVDYFVLENLGFGKTKDPSSQVESGAVKNRNIIDLVEHIKTGEQYIYKDQVPALKKYEQDFQEAFVSFLDLPKHPAFAVVKEYDQKNHKVMYEKNDLITLKSYLESLGSKEDKEKNKEDLLVALRALSGCVEGAAYLEKNNLVLLDISPANLGVVLQKNKPGNAEGVLFDLQYLVKQGTPMQDRPRIAPLYLPGELYTSKGGPKPVQSPEMAWQFGFCLNDIIDSFEPLGVLSKEQQNKLRSVFNSMTESDPKDRMSLSQASQELQQVISSVEAG